MYLSGASIIEVIKELEHCAIVSPTHRTKWCKCTIENLLSNEEYTGNVIAYRTYNEGFPESKRYTNKGERDKLVAIGCNPAIISEASKIKNKHIV
ncbi:recombinase family protein [Clostridium sp. CX1]|uniref:recombinase family protein n=1 Tax=Clostridium sp. CX1 TaxID=2978346 RepID=UPI0021BF28F0|nr:recombinase family protein [Clostridium sp. CX1]MCT8978046.1 recombinase family protein [Clostridium sp. CX1]